MEWRIVADHIPRKRRMMNMKKRILLFLLVGVMVATSLAGCSKKDTGKKSGDVAEDYELNVGYYN